MDSIQKIHVYTTFKSKPAHLSTLQNVNIYGNIYGPSEYSLY